MQFAGIPRNIQRHASKHWGFVSAADSRWSLRNPRLTPALLCTVVGHYLRDLLIAWGAFPDTCVPPTMTLNALGSRPGHAQTQYRIFELDYASSSSAGADGSFLSKFATIVPTSPSTCF